MVLHDVSDLSCKTVVIERKQKSLVYMTIHDKVNSVIKIVDLC
jgi:hypothetical protein